MNSTLWLGLLGKTVRSMRGSGMEFRGAELCTPAQERGPAADNASCGARLWQTHATSFQENLSPGPSRGGYVPLVYPAINRFSMVLCVGVQGA